MLSKTISWLNEPLAPVLTGADLRAEIAGMARLRGAMDARDNRLAAALEAEVGGRESIEVLREATGCSRREARRRTEQAKVLKDMPNAAKALAEGRITTEHADALVRAAKDTDPAAVDADTKLLHQVADTPADKAGKLADEWARQRQEPEDLEAAHRRARAKRRMDFFPTEDNTLRASITGDNTTMAMIQATVLDMAQRLHHNEGGRDNPKHERTWAQYRYDAMLVALGIEPFPPPPARGPSGAATTDDPESTWATGGAAWDVGSRDGGPGDGRPKDGRPGDGEHGNGRPGDGRPVDGGPGGYSGRCSCGRRGLSQRNQIVVVAQLDDLAVEQEDTLGGLIPGTGPISRSELERLACDAELQGLIFNGRGEPLWLGRRRRSASAAQRTALVARDKGCVLCGTSPHHCHAHHIVPWQNDGPTDIDNLALVCHQDHAKIHDRKLRLHRRPDGTWTTTHDPKMAEAHDTS